MIGSEIFVWRVHTESNLKVQLVNIERMHRSVAFVLFWITGMKLGLNNLSSPFRSRELPNKI